MAHIQPPPVLAYGLTHAAGLISRELGDWPSMSTTTFIGILVAITGNVLISFALNLQKLVHKRIEEKYSASDAESPHKLDSRHPVSPLPEEEEEESLVEDQARRSRSQEGEESETPQNSESSTLLEVQPVVPAVTVKDYGATSTASETTGPHRDQAIPPRTFASRLVPFKLQTQNGVDAAPALPVEVVSEASALQGLGKRQKTQKQFGNDSNVDDNEGLYLKSKLWWLGFLLMNVGEVGNFISYAFAPASVVAPLGTFALIANCFFAPLMLKERFRKRDLAGVGLAVLGATTVVLASNSSDTHLDYDSLLKAIKQIPFIVFSGIYIVAAIILATLSRSSMGRRWVFIDVGLCAIFGGFTVLSTKAISTLLTHEWIGIFTQWGTYPILFVLVGTGVGQVRYLNRALMRFDSKTVIPIQFVLFTLSAIIGSAILYGDFKTAKFHQVVTFLYGCAATFAGVFVIAWAPNEQTSDGATDGGLAEETNSVTSSPDQARLGQGTIGRRRRATLVLPSGVTGIRDAPGIRHARSSLTIGISPAQHLLLVHTPPAELPLSAQMREDGIHDPDTELGFSSPDSYGRQHSWYGGDLATGRGTRDSSLAGARRPFSIGAAAQGRPAESAPTSANR
ncbi:magnesium transporter NIPA-domain-containing protein [Coprinopsis sp. MPI-PUGE-AT-0042]|nr:magnesium transporter NIPA-domain-containing protein [Coprinopsis sp. MPI-PUGE-AT-0042]